MKQFLFHLRVAALLTLLVADVVNAGIYELEDGAKGKNNMIIIYKQ